MLNYSYIFLTVYININTEEQNLDSTEIIKSLRMTSHQML